MIELGDGLIHHSLPHTAQDSCQRYSTIDTIRTEQITFYMKILSVSDQVDPRIYSKKLKERHNDVAFVISCGDLPYEYLEYIMSGLNKPLYYVHGNHDQYKKADQDDTKSEPSGAENLHRKIYRQGGVLLAGVEGCIKYNRKTKFQYSQGDMWFHVLSLVPGLLYNKLVYGRFLDIFVTHAPPRGIHEGEDWTHQGIQAFRWLIETFKPAYHIHGHIHVYRPDTVIETRIGNPLVINTFQSRVTEFQAGLD
jgi:Icc-related predicted phosphoesterase